MSESDWYKDAVIYQLHVRSFADSDADGIGDFPGLTSRLDYIEDLGVTAIWLLPFYPSPLRDDGYDIADYNAINPSYGDMRSFRRFLAEAHRRQIKVITELVMNHTSDQHPWFQRARRAPRGSRLRDFYVWSDSPGRHPEARIIFQDFETSNWTWDPVAGQYFWHRFYSHQPDLNFDNASVRRAMLKALDTWLDMGVDGLRLDAIPYLFERDGTNCENLPETHQFLRDVRAHMDARYPDRMLLAEANQWPEDAVAYFGTDDAPECHMCFHFPLMPRLYTALRQENRLPIVDVLEQTPAIPRTAQWATFLRNHDELTLEMVTDEERVGMYRAYAQDPQMRVNLGIRRRLAPLLQNDRRKIELMNNLLFSLPGAPVIYYGDEIGMGDNIYLGDRNGVRTPMQWSADRNAGFSRAGAQQSFLPVNIDAEYHYETVNVEAMQHNPNSLLWWMKRMIALRKQHPALSRGPIEFLDPDNHKVLAFIRRTPDEWPQTESLLVVANLSRYAQSTELDLRAFGGHTPVELFGRTRFAPVGEQPYYVTLAPYAVYWFLLDPSTAALDRSDQSLPVLDIDADWRELLSGRTARRLQPALRAFLGAQRWFGGKTKEVTSISVTDVIEVTDDDVLAVIGVEYAEGDTESYAVPLVAVPVDALSPTDVRRPIARLHHRNGNGHGDLLLCDASTDEPFARKMLDLADRRGRLNGDSGRLVATRVQGRPRFESHPTVRLLGVDQSNTSTVFGDQVVMKMFRKLEPGENPDAEMTRYLSHDTRFHSPASLLGTIDYAGTAPTQTVAVFHRFVANEGDGWHHTLDELDRFLENVLALGVDPDTTGRDSWRSLPDHHVADPLIDSYLASVRQLARSVGDLHEACSRGGGAAFTPEPSTKLYQRSLYDGFRSHTRAALRELRQNLHALPDDARDGAVELGVRQNELIARFEPVRSASVDALRIRTHGDLHLGQVLHTGQDFVIIDFEGEPGRPLAERRIKRSAMRDVAGMIRSFHYAAEVGLHHAVQRGLVDTGSCDRLLSPWANWWRERVVAAFLESYLESVTHGRVVPTNPVTRAVLLEAYLLDKALYELRYELGSRPHFARIPIRGLIEILDQPVGSMSC